MKKWNLVVSGIIIIFVLVIIQKYFLKSEGFAFYGVAPNAPCPVAGSVRWLGWPPIFGTDKDLGCFEKGTYDMYSMGNFTYYDKCTFRIPPRTRVRADWVNGRNAFDVTAGPNGTNWTTNNNCYNLGKLTVS